MGPIVLVVRFALELCALAAFAIWGADASGVVLAVAAPVAGAVLWGLFAAPKSDRRLADPARLGFELLFFGAAALGLALADHPAAGATLGALALADCLAVRAAGVQEH